MEINNLDLLNKKPKSTFFDSFGNVSSTVDSTSASSFMLTDDQQKILDNQLNLDKNFYKDAESIYIDLKNKYAL